MLGVGASEKTYMDDVFSTYVYQGDSSTRSINNGIDLSGEGGMVWIKQRSGSENNIVHDTVRGAGERLLTDGNYSNAGLGSRLTAFNNNGFNLGNDGQVNDSNHTYASWSFRKTKGFFTICEWDGDGNAGRQISHDLGCEPGLIIIKRLNAAAGWITYHRSLGAENLLDLSENAPAADLAYFHDTVPTSTYFKVGSTNHTNGSAEDDRYVAYLWAGGESTAANARSIILDGSNDAIKTSTSSDYDFGTGDFTVEFWIKVDEIGETYQTVDHRTSSVSSNHWVNYIDTDGSYKFWSADSTRITGKKINAGQWYHIATVRNSGTTTLYIDGISQGTYADTNDYSNQRIIFGAHGPDEGSYPVNGSYSNIRIVKGTAVYTSSFRPPTEPLTNITNTKFLAANNSSVTGTTVGTAVAIDSPTASTDSPFDDPAGFVFGDAGDQNVIKTGSYIGNGSSDGPEVYVGFEPQWLLLKNSSISDTWYLYNSMMGIVTGGDDIYLQANDSSAQANGGDKIDLTSTGFKIKNNNADLNGNGNTIIYLAIRRSDGYVGKPPELGTGVFSLATGTNNTIPGFVSGFPVDFSLRRPYASSSSWYAASRLTGTNYLVTDGTSSEASNSNQTFDYQNGIGKWGGDLTSWMSWQWKRHAGFDVVTYKGNGTAGHQIPHSMNAVPEMMWVKNRTDTNFDGQYWLVYHKGVNSGVNPEQYFLKLNESGQQVDQVAAWNDTAPTSSNFTLGLSGGTNGDGYEHIAFLFSSVSGISHCGSFTGTGNTANAQTTGFSPRFLIIKTTNQSAGWYVFDTVRGLSSAGDDPYLLLNSNAAQAGTSNNPLNVSSTGFSFDTSNASSTINISGATYIYYAHA